MADIIVLIIILILVGSAIMYLVKAKKSGRACASCPASSTCGKKKCDCEGKKC